MMLIVLSCTRGLGHKEHQIDRWFWCGIQIIPLERDRGRGHPQTHPASVDGAGRVDLTLIAAGSDRPAIRADLRLSSKPTLRIDLLHVMFIEGFTFLMGAVGTRVVLSHGGDALTENRKTPSRKPCGS